MLVKFSLRNYKTFREKAELSLVASNYDKETRQENIIDVPKFNLRLLKSAVVYGANASGKSKLIDGLDFMRDFVKDSSKDTQIGDPIDVEPFRLNTLSETEPSEFEVVFIHEDVLYRYGFEVTQKEVICEWLYYKQNTKDVELFYRERQNFDNHSRSFGGIVNQLIKEKSIRENALLLSVAAQFNNKRASAVLNWFREIGIISGLSDRQYKGFTVSKIRKPEEKNQILSMLQLADLGIEDLKAKLFETSEIPQDMPDDLKKALLEQVKGKKVFSDILTTHRKYNSNNESAGEVIFSMNNDESSGTGKFFSIMGPVLDALETGSIMVVDELDSKLHPNLVCKLIALFNSESLNPHNGQLIFNTHDTNLLSGGHFRRDQIWFTEKDRYGAATLYSLADFKTDTVRKDEDYEANYIKGKYGAVPYLGDFSRLGNLQ